MNKCREIRKILLGRTVLRGKLVCAAHPGEVAQSVIGANGTLTTALLGVAAYCEELRMPKDCDAPEEAAGALLELGIPVHLDQYPNAIAALARASMREEVLYGVEFGENTLTLTVFTGRGLFSGMALRRAARAFERKLSKVEEVRPVKLRRQKRSEKKEEKHKAKHEAKHEAKPAKKKKA